MRDTKSLLVISYHKNDASGTGTGFHSILFFEESLGNALTLQGIAEGTGYSPQNDINGILQTAKREK